MIRDYDATPANFLGRSRDWYKLAALDKSNPIKDFTIAKYVAFCFSLEFLLKALICVNKSNAQKSTLQKFSHKLGQTKVGALKEIKDQQMKNLIQEFFKKYPEFENVDVVETRYGKLGSVSSYDAGALVDELYEKLLASANKTVRQEWTWR